LKVNIKLEPLSCLVFSLFEQFFFKIVECSDKTGLLTLTGYYYAVPSWWIFL